LNVFLGKTKQLRTDFRQVLNEHSALLGRVAATYESNFHLRQELLQEITLAVWQALEKFNGDSSVKTYVLRVAHNKAITHVAYHAKQPRNASYCEVETPEPSRQTTTDEQLVQQQQIQTMLKEIRKMPIQTRQIVTMSMEGLSYAEIAEACGVSNSNAGVILNRARKVLMESIQHA
jgi:RNA polymerase sigma-70 factor (ECF subfamily)